jgi:hypothetical protein
MEIEDIRRPEIVVNALDKLTKREQKYLTEYYINIGKDMSGYIQKQKRTSNKEKTCSDG